jgi:hypothetical protein
MNPSFEFVSKTDKPALIAFSTPEWLDAAKASLQELGYKVHTAATHGDFLIRYSSTQYQVVLIEELFGANTIYENLTLKSVQNMPIAQRRHTTFLLVGESFQTFMTMEAFKHSVHAVINSSELFLLNQLVEKAVGDNSAFLQSFRDVQTRLFSGTKSH